MEQKFTKEELGTWIENIEESEEFDEAAFLKLLGEITYLNENPPTILALDDDPKILTILEKILQSRGYQCITAQETKHAIKYCNDNTIDLIFVDLNVPHIDGLSFIKIIRRNPESAKIPIIIYTAVTIDKVIDRVKELKVNSFIQKPSNVKIILEKVQSLLNPPEEEPPERIEF